MTTIISGNTPTSIGDDTTINGDITANNLPTNGSIVGYQQGLWLPDFGSTSNQSQWVTKGLAENLAGTSTASLVGEFSATFSRIGQTETLQALIRFQGTGGTLADTFPVQWRGLPYVPSDADTIMAIPSVVSGTAGYMGTTYFSDALTNLDSGVTQVVAYIYTGSGAATDGVTLTLDGPLYQDKALGANNLGSGYNQYHMMTITYKTDDTTWVPAPGRTTGVTP